MAEDLNIRFSENSYLNKSEVSKELKSNLIDPIYQNILNYRKSFRKNLTVKNYTGLPFNICWLRGVTDKEKSFTAKFEDKFNEFKLGSETNNSFSMSFKRAQIRTSIKELGIFYGDKTIDEEFIANFVKAGFDYEGTNKAKIKIRRYFKCLNSLRSNTSQVIDEDFLINLYTMLSEKELTSLYRNEDFFNRYEQSAVIPSYKGAAFERIPDLMSSLIEFLSMNDYDDFIKATIAFYYINYVKPFEDYNEEISLILFKKILSKKYKDYALFFFPFEILLSKLDEFNPANVEAYKNLDLTYFLLKTIDVLLTTEVLGDTQVQKENQIKRETQKQLGNDFIDLFSQKEERKKLDVSSFDNQQYSKPVSQIKKEEYIEKNISSNSRKLEQPKPKTVQHLTIEDVEGPLYKKPEPTPVKKEEPTKVLVHENVVVKKPTIKEVVQAPTMVSRRKPPVPKTYNENDAKTLAKYLIEVNPRLHKSQAKFLASHCTMGRYYSIEDFKKYIGCVYETARTSMDGLAALGYYQKEQVKNKFVYTLKEELIKE